MMAAGSDEKPILHVDRRANGVVEIVLCRPPANALNLRLLSELASALNRLEGDVEARAVLIRAEGKGFSAGGDVKEVQALPGFEGILGQVDGLQRAVLAIMNCAVPVVMAVHGYCVGGGVLLAGAADIVAAAEGARFILAEIDYGATAGGILALRLMPEKRVRAAMMTADPVTAEELHAFGSVLLLVAPEELAGAARALAAKIAAKPADPMRRLKRSLNHSMRVQDVEAAYRAEVSYTYELNISGAAAAGRAAFIDRGSAVVPNGVGAGEPDQVSDNHRAGEHAD